MTDHKKSSLSRGDFIKRSALGFAGLTLGTRKYSSPGKTEILDAPRLKKKYAPNDRIQIATIGMGIIANYDTPTALKIPGVEFVAAADCYDSRLVHVKEAYGKDIFTTRKYEEVLARPDVDAVIISVPDHWHARISMDAMKAGKHVYCEKPMVHQISEGTQVIDTWKKTGKVMQVGSQFASDILYLKAGELFRSGAIGRLNQVKANYDRNSALGAWQYTMPEDANTKTVDWDRFQGNAPKVAWDPKRFFRWRCYWDYGTGVPGDLFVHLFTAVHTVVGAHGPTRISATGGIRYWEDGRQVPDVILGQYEYPKTDAHPDFTLTLQTNLEDGGGGGQNFQFIGDEGMIEVGWNSVKLIQNPRRSPSLNALVKGYNSVFTFSKKVQQEFIDRYTAEHANDEPKQPDMDRSTEYKTPDGYDARLDHFANFFDSIRNGKPTFENPVFGFRAAAPALMTNMSYRQKKMIEWDPEKMRLVNS